jgi:hypothetical protein
MQWFGNPGPGNRVRKRIAPMKRTLRCFSPEGGSEPIEERNGRTHETRLPLAGFPRPPDPCDRDTGTKSESRVNARIQQRTDGAAVAIKRSRAKSTRHRRIGKKAYRNLGIKERGGEIRYAGTRKKSRGCHQSSRRRGGRDMMMEWERRWAAAAEVGGDWRGTVVVEEVVGGGGW